MITVVTFLWQRAADPLRYSAGHVNALRDALARYLPRRHRLVCVTSNPEGLDWRIECVPVTQELVEASSRRFLKLALFRRDAADLFGGERLLGIDLDVTPVGDLGPLVDRSEDFVIWRDPLFGREGYERSHLYNSSLILMNAGCRPQVYETFDAAAAQDNLSRCPLVGSDQKWIGHVLGPNEAVWTQADGVLGYKHDILPLDPSGRTWPADARLIVSHGRPKPWELDADHSLRVAYERNEKEIAA